MKQTKQLSRKDIRKQKKQQKKQRIQKSHQWKTHKHTDVKGLAKSQTKRSMNQSAKGNDNNLKAKEKVKSKPNKNVNQKLMKEQMIQQFDSEDERIEMYEKKLRMDGNSKKYGKLAKNMGFDNDLFSFLDNISKKVKSNKHQNQPQDQQQYQQYEEEQEDSRQADEDDLQQEFQEQLDGSDFDNEQMQMWDKLGEQGVDEDFEEEQSSIEKQKVNEKKSQNKSKIGQNKPKLQGTQKNSKDFAEQTRPKLFNNSDESVQVHKKMNSLFNKLSDGNILITFRQFVKIIQSHPKSITYSTFANLFTKFNLLIEKPLVHVMSANIVVAVSLHRVYGDRLMAIILYELTQGFCKLQKQQDNMEEVEEIGYSKVFEKRKNYVSIISYLYQFGSISGSFPQSLVSILAENITNKQNIEMIYQVIQKCGVRMRSHDPATLKEVIEILKKLIEQSKKIGLYETTKIKFIEIEINEIRFNKKGLFDADQRMGFLHTFLNKTVKDEMSCEVRTLDVTFNQFQQQKDISKPEFWINDNCEDPLENISQKKTSKNRIIQNDQVRQLIQLAKSMHFVTQIKRNIFVELMSSQDYIQATKRLLEMRIKRLQDIASVLMEVNLQESSFNPFYSLVACKIAQQIPKFRVTLQFALWDKLKRIHEFEPRKVSNLGKFIGWLISSEQANCSLSLLKFFPDITSLRPEEDIFMKVLFKEVLKKSSKSWINRLCHKLAEEKNRMVRDGIRDFVGELIPCLDNETHKSKGILLRKLLAIQFQAEIEEE